MRAAVIFGLVGILGIVAAPGAVAAQPDLSAALAPPALIPTGSTAGGPSIDLASRGGGEVWLASALGALLGGAAISVAGYRIDLASDEGVEDPGLGGLVFGALVGTSVGSALGAHLAADDDRRFLGRLLTSSAIGAGGFLVAAAIGGGGGAAVALSIPVVQVVVSSL